MNKKGKTWQKLVAGVVGVIFVLELTVVPWVYANDASQSATITEPQTIISVETGAAISESVLVQSVNETLVGESTIAVTVEAPVGTESAMVFASPQPVATTSGMEATEDGEPPLELMIQNEASVSASVSATASSGQITINEADRSVIETGAAVAVAHSVTLVNTTLVDSELQIGVVGITENWSGDLYLPAQGTSGGGGIIDPSKIKLTLDNQGNVVVGATAQAMTGEITQTGGVLSAETGTAVSVASSLSFVDTTLINSLVDAVWVDNLSLWSGLIYNYRGLGSVDSPQQLWLSTPSTSTCDQNMSCANAMELTINNRATVESQSTAVADSGEIEQQASAGVVKTGEAIALASNTVLANTTLINSRLRLLRILLAAPWSGNLIFVYPESPQPEPSPTPTPTLEPTPTQEREDGGQSTEVPQLRLSGGHNADNGIYPGDGVTYEITITNDGPITAHQVVLVQEFYTPEGVLVSRMEGKVGEIGVNKRRNVHFVLYTGRGAGTGVYTTRTVATGQSDQGTKTSSNVMDQLFRILGKVKIAQAGAVDGQYAPAEEIWTEEVLGTSTGTTCPECWSTPWYIAIFLGSLLYYGVCAKRQDWRGVVRMGLPLPLAAYLGLWRTNPLCQAGVEMVKGNPWCEYFLLIAVGIYLINGGVVKLGKVLATKMSRQ